MAQDVMHSFITPDEVATAVADAFVDFVARSICETGSCIVAITGGTIPNRLFELLNTPVYIDRIDWERTFFLWTDERFISQSDPDNHFYRAKKRLFSNMCGASHFFPIHTDKGTVRNAADEYDKEVKTILRARDKKGVDLAILGLGQDGHTAGLFPRSLALQEDGRYVVAVEDGNVWDRVTMTFSFLSQARHVWYTVVGDAKRAALAKVLQQRFDYEDSPWRERIGHVLPGAVLSQAPIDWFVDQEAYQVKTRR